jgi:hypothetical protein
LTKLTKLPLLLVVFAFGAFALAACGGGDDTAATDSTQGTPLSEADFTSQGNAICSAGNEEIDAAGADLGQNPSQADIEAFATDTLVPSIQGQIDDISALGAPEGETEQVDAFLTDAQDTLDKLKNDPGLAVQSDLFADVNKEATAIGLTECAG